SAGQELASRIVNIDFDKQRARRNVNGVGVANESAMKGLAREFIEGQSGWGTRARGAGVHLGDGDVKAERANGGHVKEFPRLCAGPRIDERPDVRMAGGDDAVEGRIDFLKRLQLLQSSHI